MLHCKYQHCVISMCCWQLKAKYYRLTKVRRQTLCKSWYVDELERLLQHRRCASEHEPYEFTELGLLERENASVLNASLRPAFSPSLMKLSKVKLVNIKKGPLPHSLPPPNPHCFLFAFDFSVIF